MAKSSSCNSNSPSQVGFTLVEVVISLGILGVMLAAAYGMVAGISRSKIFLDDVRDAQTVANAVLSRMVHELQLATKSASLPPPCDNPETRYPSNVNLKGVRISGPDQESIDSITFLASEGGQYLPDGGGHSGVVQITYRVEKTPPDDTTAAGPLTLVREEIPLIRPAKRACERLMVFPLTSAVVSLKFSYYDSEKAQWSDDWEFPAQSDLPSLIRLQLKLRSPSGKQIDYTTAVAVRS